MNADIHSCIVLVRSMKLAKIHSNVHLSSMNYLIVSNSHAQNVAAIQKSKSITCVCVAAIQKHKTIKSKFSS